MATSRAQSTSSAKLHQSLCPSCREHRARVDWGIVAKWKMYPFSHVFCVHTCQFVHARQNHSTLTDHLRKNCASRAVLRNNVIIEIINSFVGPRPAPSSTSPSHRFACVYDSWREIQVIFYSFFPAPLATPPFLGKISSGYRFVIV